MPRALDLLGQRFGRLVALERAGSRFGGADWLCQCDCGEVTRATSNMLRSGNTRSCGCLHRDSARANTSRFAHPPVRHGHASGDDWSRTYTAWKNMWGRVRGYGASYRRNYVARGITACQRWRRFEAFLEDMGECPPGLSLDRIDNDGNYEPGNCRWATVLEQLHNRRPYASRSKEESAP